jgi:ribosomal protein S27E
MSANSIQEVFPDDAQAPSCHVCGAEMVKRGQWGGKHKTHENDYAYDCMACGATTGCT